MQGNETQAGFRPPWRGLLVLNVLLLAVLAAVTFGDRAEAQVRQRGQYTMVAGRANGAQGGVVFIVDSVNQELIGVTYSANARDLVGVGYRNLAADAASMQRRGSSR